MLEDKSIFLWGARAGLSGVSEHEANSKVTVGLCRPAATAGSLQLCRSVKKGLGEWELQLLASNFGLFSKAKKSPKNSSWMQMMLFSDVFKAKIISETNIWLTAILQESTFLSVRTSQNWRCTWHTGETTKNDLTLRLCQWQRGDNKQSGESYIPPLDLISFSEYMNYFPQVLVKLISSSTLLWMWIFSFVLLLL